MTDNSIDDIRSKIANLGGVPDEDGQVQADPVPAQPQTPTEPAADNRSDDQKYQDLLNQDIVTLLGKDDSSQEEKDEIKRQASQDIQEMAYSQIINTLPEDKKEQFQNLLNSNDNTQITQFMTDNGVNLKSVMFQAALIYKSNVVNQQTVAGI